jgi:sugar lactone lactonase YvrE
LGLTLRVGDRTSNLYPFALAVTLAAELHPVTSPVVASDRSVITTVSGSRGQEVPNPLIRVTRSAERVPFACDIMNPTGLVFGPDRQLYVSSRHDGTVYRYRDFEELEPVADDLGIACGLAFDSEGMLYVGDRAGRIIRLDPFGDMRAEYARLEPSVSAYHLAMDANDVLYVTGPTLAMRDPLYRIAAKGNVETVVRGLARPQGMAFTAAGELLIATSYAGRKGIFRLAPGSSVLEYYIAGPTLVGIATSGEDLFPADATTVYWLQRK